MEFLCSDYRADTLSPYASGLTACGCSSMVEPQPSKLAMPVRSRSPAPRISARIYKPLPAYLFLLYAIDPTITNAAFPIRVIGYEPVTPAPSETRSVKVVKVAPIVITPCKIKLYVWLDETPLKTFASDTD